MRTYMEIFIGLLIVIFLSAFWLDYYSNIRYENKKLKSDYALLEEKYFKLQREFSQVWKDKNKWIRETDRLKEKEGK